MTRRRRSLLAFAYACEPGKGSEPAAGWAWTRILGQLGDTWVITRANNRESVERGLADVAEQDRPRFVYVDLPIWARFWKRGQRGIRLYYLLWQVAAFLEARRLEREHNFDLVVHLTLANAWLGSTACFLKAPFIYGPVGGGVKTRWRLVGALGLRGALYEVGRVVARSGGRYLNPLSRASMRRASLILTLNHDTRMWLPRRFHQKAIVCPNVLLDAAPVRTRDTARDVMLYGGRLLPWKGVSLAIRALSLLPAWRLIVCGTGPDLIRLEKLADRLNVRHRVDFRGWVARTELHRTMREDASVFIFPSLHDDSPWTVVEALAAGLPVVCLDIGGPPALVGCHTAVQSASLAVTVARIASGVLTASRADRGAQRSRADAFLLQSRCAEIEGLLEQALISSTPPATSSQGRS